MRSIRGREAGTVASNARWRHGLRRATPWLAAGLVLALVGAVGGARAVPFLTNAPTIGYGHSPDANVTLALQVNDSTFSPRFLSEPPATNLSIHITNVGHQVHSFVLSNDSGLRFSGTTPSQLNASVNAHPLSANVTVAPGTSAWANFSILPTEGFDSFEFISQVPYQFQGGLWGLLNITSTAPGTTLYDNTTNALSFQPSILADNASHYPSNVNVFVANLGDLGHTFTIAPQPNVTVTTVGYFHSHAPLANQTIPSTAGKGAWANFTVPAPGIYEFVCTVAGHFTGGMFGFLYAGVPPPPPPPPLPTGVVDLWVLAGSVALLGIGGLLVVVAGFGGRFAGSPPAH